MEYIDTSNCYRVIFFPVAVGSTDSTGSCNQQVCVADTAGSSSFADTAGRDQLNLDTAAGDGGDSGGSCTSCCLQMSICWSRWSLMKMMGSLQLVSMCWNR